jgi:hypothetical protein
VGGTLQNNWETLELRWFSLEALPDTLFTWFREPLRDAFSASAVLPVSKTSHQGISEILSAIRIDLRMRISNNRAG